MLRGLNLTSMAQKSSVEVLQDAYPGRVALSPQEVARAICGVGKDTKKRVESVRNALDNRSLIPGLRKNGSRWLIPIPALGAAMDEKRCREVPTHMPVPGVRRSKHSTIGPRMLFQQARARDALLAVLGELEVLEACCPKRGIGRCLDSRSPHSQRGAFQALGLTGSAC